MRRIVRLLPIVSILVAAAFAFAGFATAANQPSNPPPGAAGPPPKLPPVNTTECTPVNKDGYQLCSSDKGALQLLAAPNGEPFYELGLTYVHELRHNGAVVYRSEERHIDLDLTKAGNAPAHGHLRADAAIVAGSVTCTFNDNSVFANNQLRRELSNLVCGPSE